MNAFCTSYVRNIIDLYHAVKQKDSYKVDNSLKEKHMAIEDRRKLLDVFNCSQHLMTAECDNDICKAEHTTVLAKDQQDRFERLMAAVKNTYIRTRYTEEESKVWREIQRIFQMHNKYEFFKLKLLDDFEAHDPKTYLDMYIKETNKISPAEGYAYVRSPAKNSDFSGFHAGTELPKEKVVSCDDLQKVVR
jgi:hypothetical protein